MKINIKISHGNIEYVDISGGGQEYKVDKGCYYSSDVMEFQISGEKTTIDNCKCMHGIVC